MIYIGLPVVMNIFSFYIKWNYPIYNEEMNRKISEGIVMHASGLPAEDPVTGKVIPPKGNLTPEEINDGNLLDHFSLNDLKRLCKEVRRRMDWAEEPEVARRCEYCGEMMS